MKIAVGAALAAYGLWWMLAEPAPPMERFVPRNSPMNVPDSPLVPKGVALVIGNTNYTRLLSAPKRAARRHGNRRVAA